MGQNTAEGRLELTAVDVTLTKTVKEGTRAVNDMRAAYEKLAGFLGIAIGAGTFGEFMKDIIETRAALEDLSKMIGGNVTDLDGLRRQAVVSGLAFDQLTTTMAKFAKNLNATSEVKNEEGQTAAQALKAIGLSADELRAKAPDQALVAVAQALGQFQDGAGKVAVAVALMGRSGAEMLPMLKDIYTDGEAAGRITAEQAKQAEQLEHEWRKLKLAFVDSKDAIADLVIPELTRLVEEMREGIKIAGGFGNAIRLFGWGISPFASAADNIRNLNQQLKELQDQRDRRSGAGGRLGIRANPEAISGIDSEIADVQKKFQFLHYQEDAAYAAAGNRGRGGNPVAGSKTLTFAPNPPDHSAEQELKSYTAALKTYFEALGHISGMTQSEKAHFELFGQDVTTADGKVIHLAGSLEKLTAGHKQSIQALADETTKRQNLIVVYEALEEHVKAHTAAVEAEQAIQRARRQSDADYLDDLQFQLDLVGKTTIEQQQLNEARRVDLALRQQIRQISDAAGDDIELYTANVAAARDAAEKQKAAVLDSVNTRIAAERSFATGAKAAIDDYVDHATNAAEQSKTLFASAFQTLEDLEMDFVTNSGKNWEQLATSFIKQIIRMQLAAQNAYMFGGQSGANAKGPLDGLMNWFGFGGSSAGGSLAGADSGVSGAVSPFADAAGAAFATGGSFMVGGDGGTDTTPISFRATKGERVSVETPGQQRGGQGGMTVYIDATGADQAAISRLEARLTRLNASVERRAVSAVGGLATRRPSYSRALQSHK